MTLFCGVFCKVKGAVPCKSCRPTTYRQRPWSLLPAKNERIGCIDIECKTPGWQSRAGLSADIGFFDEPLRTSKHVRLLSSRCDAACISMRRSHSTAGSDHDAAIYAWKFIHARHAALAASKRRGRANRGRLWPAGHALPGHAQTCDRCDQYDQRESKRAARMFACTCFHDRPLSAFLKYAAFATN